MNLHKIVWNFFGMPKILPLHTKLLPHPEKFHMWWNNGLRCPHEWPDVFTISAEFEHFLYRVSIWCQFWDRLMPTKSDETKSSRSIHLPHPVHYFARIFRWPSFFVVRFRRKNKRCTIRYLDVPTFYISWKSSFIFKNCQNICIKSTILQLEKTKNIWEILFLYILNMLDFKRLALMAAEI